jgi:hypothetical protein
MYVMYRTGFERVSSYDKISSCKLKLIPPHHAAMVICPCLLYLNGLTAILLIYDFNTQSGGLSLVYIHLLLRVDLHL